MADMKKKSSLHELAVRLCEGGYVEFNGHVIRAKVIDTAKYGSCYICEMDSICDMNFTDLCEECDRLTHKWHILELA